jgi:hypothetical protein
MTTFVTGRDEVRLGDLATALHADTTEPGKDF